MRNQKQDCALPVKNRDRLSLNSFAKSFLPAHFSPTGSECQALIHKYNPGGRLNHRIQLAESRMGSQSSEGQRRKVTIRPTEPY